jgi:hypothetical protein
MMRRSSLPGFGRYGKILIKGRPIPTVKLADGVAIKLAWVYGPRYPSDDE